jgi:hypothetical protein
MQHPPEAFLKAFSLPMPTNTTPAERVGMTDHNPHVVVATLWLERRDTGMAADIARDIVGSRTDVVSAAFNRNRIEIVGLVTFDADEDQFTWTDGLMLNVGMARRRYVAADGLDTSYDPAEWQDRCFRPIERDARAAMQVASRLYGKQAHQCNDPALTVCLCAATGNLLDNTEASRSGERGYMPGQLIDPRVAE